MYQYTTDFASIYDEFMDNVPRQDWGGFIVDFLKRKGICDGLLLDLGCGTGIITRFLARAGYDMIGVDASFEMLNIARNIEESAKGQSEGEVSDILYLCQDMRELELYGTVRAVVSVCDPLNYVLSEDELLKVFTLVNNYLDEGGYFIFDMNTPYYYSEVLGGGSFSDYREDAAIIWNNYFDEEEIINEYEVIMFKENENGLYEKSVENHYEKGYEIDKIKELIEEAGMEFIACYDGYSDREAVSDSERVVFIAREKRQKGKLYI